MMQASTPTCHPDRPHKAKGLCHQCYYKHYHAAKGRCRPYRRKPECHPDRYHAGNGLCRTCYNKTPERAAAIKKYTDENATRDRLKSRYGLTLEQWEMLDRAQHGLCAICGQPPRGKMKRLSVDHNHETKTVRGLLCITCNRALGWLDNPDWLAKAQAYLAQYA